MAFAVFEEIHEEELKQKTRASFANEILELQALDFIEDYYLRVTLFPLSAVILAPFTLHMIFKGVPVSMTKFLQAVESGIVLVHKEGYVYGLPDKLQGTKYVTLFDDNTLLTTSVRQTILKDNPQNRFLCYVSESQTVQGAWLQHLDKVRELTEQGHEAVSPLTIKDLLEMEYRSFQSVFGERQKGKNKRS